MSWYASHLTVRGTPVAKGSTRSFAVRRGGRLTGQTVTTQGNRATLAPWVEAIQHAALRAFKSPTREAVILDMVFRFRRPKSHVKKDGTLRASAPTTKTTKPDGDKLARAVMDALTGIAYVDDAQVVCHTARKGFATASDPEGVVLEVSVWREEGR